MLGAEKGTSSQGGEFPLAQGGISSLQTLRKGWEERIATWTHSKAALGQVRGVKDVSRAAGRSGWLWSSIPHSAQLTKYKHLEKRHNLLKEPCRDGGHSHTTRKPRAEER